MKRVKKFELIKVKGLIFFILLSLFALTNVSCNQNKSSSNSLEQYKQLRKNMGPVHSEKPINQNYMQTDLYSINPENVPKVVFQVGKRNTLRINTSLHLPGTSYRLVSKDLPQGSEPLKNIENGIWEMSWTPSADLMPSFKSGAIRSFHLSLEIIDSTDLRAKEILKNFAAESTIEYTLEFPKSAPEIIEIHGIAPFPELTKLNEGDVIPLIIRIKDESSSSTQKPSIINPLEIDKFVSKESTISGSRFLILKSYATPVPNSPGVWDIEAEFNTKIIPVPTFQSELSKALPDKIISHLNIQVRGANSILSTEKIVSFEITYRRELLRPVIKTDSPGLELVSQGSKFKFKYETYLPTSVGILSSDFDDESKKLPEFPIKPKCVTVSKSISRLLCEITWTVPCSQPVGEINIKIVSSGEYNEQRTSTELIKKLSITENEKKCSSAPKEPRKKESSKGDKK